MSTLALALWLGVWAFWPLLGFAEPHERAVTDLTSAPADDIRVGDLVEGLSLPRGSRIQLGSPVTLRLPVQFETNSAKLTGEAERLLDKLGEALRSTNLQGYRFSIEGHTDAIGPDGYNQRLSERRAAAVKAFLLGQGVADSALRTVGKGELAPVDTNETAAGRRHNRRVEVINVGK